MKYSMVISMVAGKAQAEKIAFAVVKEKLAACANIVPGITSVYWWKGKVEKAGEYMLVIKTVSSKAGRLVKRVKSLHSYEVPEIVVFDIKSGYPAYLKWIAESTGAK